MDPEESPLSPDGGIAMPDQIPKQHRSLRSLNALATKFVRLLQEADDGVLDLKYAVKVLAVGQKRRIYDITNVLEGVGLIVKISKSIIKWTGALPGETAHRLANRLMELKSELADLEQKEYMLDQQKFWVEQSIRNTTEDCGNLAYVNHDDICNCFSAGQTLQCKFMMKLASPQQPTLLQFDQSHTLLAVRAPPGTQLDVPIPKAVLNSPPKYQIHLKSINGPIDVVLLNKHSVSSVPVVLPVPPPEEILRSAKLVMSTSDVTESSIASCQASANVKYGTRSRQTAMDNMLRLQSSSFIRAELKRSDTPGLEDFSKELENLLEPNKEKLNADLITELMASEVFSPLLRLSPPPSGQEYAYNLDESEGLCDLFDIPMLNV